MKEECGVVAVYRGEGKAANFVHRCLIALQHRGEEAAGIAVLSAEKEIQHLKGRGLASECLPTYQVDKLVGSKAIGHVRYSTVPADQTENIQPFIATTPYGKLAIAHNGNIKNAKDLRIKLENKGSLFSTTMDTEIIAHLIAKSKEKEFPNALKEACSKIKGAYSLTFIIHDCLYGFRDPHGIRPLVLGEREDGWVIASETCALDAVNAKYLREIKPGELVQIGSKGIRATQLLEPQKSGKCIFEMVYFSRPDSLIFGKSVHLARKKAGEILAKEDEDLKNKKPDVVVPVVDSGLPAAIGYAQKSGIPFENGLVRSHYIGRTFILPDQNSREHAVNLKLSVIPEVVKNKRVVLIDDSVVRGNTSRLIVKMVKDAGAKEVWLRVASPPISWPCYLGIDTPSFGELVFNKLRSLDEIAKFLGVENLRYISEEGLKKSVGGGQGFCLGCMNGKYPV